LLTSVETILGPVRVSEDGLLKQPREPVLVLVGVERAGSLLSCDWVFTHAGLMPGPYALSDGTTVSIPPGLCGDSHQVRRGVTLEVTT
jgi:hypothetical protein